MRARVVLRRPCDTCHTGLQDPKAARMAHNCGGCMAPSPCEYCALHTVNRLHKWVHDDVHCSCPFCEYLHCHLPAGCDGAD